jgi:2-polyprenyl-3-methyl-5-hydroxy-6-metoxy-1,4-benzoquinol methylase
MASENVVGNYYDKYGTRNPIARALMRRFLDGVTDLYRIAAPRTVLEVGCGEGKLARTLWEAGATPPERFEITDVDVSRVDPGLPSRIHVREASVYDLPYDDGAFDLVVCCEVLEHLEHPGKGLAEVARVSGHRVLLSTPWEPVWRAMNVARGKYLLQLGNTPGHVQHWSRRGLERFARTHLRLLERRTPLPWTILLGEPHR